jgi:hypothetical protein
MANGDHRRQNTKQKLRSKFTIFYIILTEDIHTVIIIITEPIRQQSQKRRRTSKDYYVSTSYHIPSKTHS